MSYLKAEDVLPQELIEAIQQYVDGRTIYIPCKEKMDWGAKTDTRRVLWERNVKVCEGRRMGMSLDELAVKFSLSEKSIQRILRDQKSF